MNIQRELIKHCHLCGREGETLHASLHDRQETEERGFGLRHCTYCGLAWLSPRPVREELPKYYPDNYYAYQVPEETPEHIGMAREVRDAIRLLILSETFGYRHLRPGICQASLIGRVLGMIPFLRRRAAFGWEELCPSYVPNGRLLDVGCGAGNYLARMREFGWEVHGVDLSQDAARVAQERYGIPVRVGMLPEVGYSDGMFNVLTMSHVIEHVPDPLAHLSECWRILAPGGQLIVRTPNMASFASRMFGKDWTALDPPRHLVLFTPSSLHACVERVGFHVIRERSHAYLASFHAQMSLFIRRQGHARGLMDVSNVGPLARFLGQVEHMLLPIWRWAGNELRLVAVKP